MTRRSPRGLGLAGEEVAARLLRRDGARVLDRNVRTRAGEIDVVALEGGTVVLVEVKARSGSGTGRPEEAVDARRLRRIERAGELYAAAHGLAGAPMRIDVIAVEVEGGKVARVRRLRDVSA